jgi:hypothetical protein
VSRDEPSAASVRPGAATAADVALQRFRCRCTPPEYLYDFEQPGRGQRKDLTGPATEGEGGGRERDGDGARAAEGLGVGLMELAPWSAYTLCFTLFLGLLGVSASDSESLSELPEEESSSIGGSLSSESCGRDAFRMSSSAARGNQPLFVMRGSPVLNAVFRYSTMSAETAEKRVGSQSGKLGTARPATSSL